MAAREAAWVIGAGGLLGSAIARKLERSGQRVHRISVDWADPIAAVLAFRVGAADYARQNPKGPWNIYWCAGNGTTTTSDSELNQELEILRCGLAEIALAYLDSLSGSFTLFFASSAGALYAGSQNPPFSENTPVSPISDYGKMKLEAEAICRRQVSEVGGTLLIGRIANIYGPGQNLQKPQGLISVFARAALTGMPVEMYVPMNTARDYLFVDDCARMIVRGLNAVRDSRLVSARVVVKIFASELSLSLEHLVSCMEASLHIQVPITHIQSNAAKLQAVELTFKSVIMTELRPSEFTTLDAGMRETFAAVKAALRPV